MKKIFLILTFTGVLCLLVCVLCSAQGSEQSSQYLEQTPASGSEYLENSYWEEESPEYNDEDGVQNKFEKYNRDLGYVENSEYEDKVDLDSPNPAHQVTKN